MDYLQLVHFYTFHIVKIQQQASGLDLEEDLYSEVTIPVKENQNF